MNGMMSMNLGGVRIDLINVPHIFVIIEGDKFAESSNFITKELMR